MFTQARSAGTATNCSDVLRRLSIFIPGVTQSDWISFRLVVHQTFHPLLIFLEGAGPIQNALTGDCNVPIFPHPYCLCRMAQRAQGS
jgi:hypothetical protein